MNRDRTRLETSSTDMSTTLAVHAVLPSGESGKPLIPATALKMHSNKNWGRKLGHLEK